MDSCAFIIDNAAVSGGQHGVKGVGVPFQWVYAYTTDVRRRLVRNNGDIPASLVLNNRAVTVSLSNTCTVIAAADVIARCINKDIAAVADFCAIVSAHDGIYALTGDAAVVFNR